LILPDWNRKVFKNFRFFAKILLFSLLSVVFVDVPQLLCQIFGIKYEFARTTSDNEFIDALTRMY
jgi:uncharacterized membrane protein